MVKVQIRGLEDRIVLEVEGRLTGAFVTEVQSAWSTARTNRPGCKMQVDLKSVTCVDREGRALLRSMHGQYECRTCGRHYPVPWNAERQFAALGRPAALRAAER